MITLNRPYAGYPAGQTVLLPASTETALIASGGAIDAGGASATPGNVSTTALLGQLTVSAGAASITVTNPNITPQTMVSAYIASTAAADATFTQIARTVVSNGSVTFFGNAAATGALRITWAIQNPLGSLSNPQ